MADRIEREIEEILAKLDQDGPLAQDKAPVSILSARNKRKTAPKPPRQPRTNLVDALNPTMLLFAGAGLVVGGLILSNAWPPLIWASFAGVVLFLGAFILSFFRSKPVGPAAAPKGVYWRDRYIEYEPPAQQSAWGRLKRRFRR